MEFDSRLMPLGHDLTTGLLWHNRTNSRSRNWVLVLINCFGFLSVTSSHRIHFPLKAVDRRTVWLAVEVVPGGTPFLLSKRAFKMLGGLLDAVQDICYMKRLHHEPIPLSFSNTGLYLVNVGDLCQGVSNLEEKCYQDIGIGWS